MDVIANCMLPFRYFEKSFPLILQTTRGMAFACSAIAAPQTLHLVHSSFYLLLKHLLQCSSAACLEATIYLPRNQFHFPNHNMTINRRSRYEA